MPRVLLVAPQPDVRTALRLVLLDLGMEIVGEATDWPAALALAPNTRPDMLLVDWDMVPTGSGDALIQLRAACTAAVVIVLISQWDARQQAAISSGADAFISKSEMPDQVAIHLRTAVAHVRSK